jgi:serine protease
VRRLVTLLAVAAAMLGVSVAAANATPRYMPNANNVGNPTLQPPPVCCIPGYESITGKLPVPTPIDMAYFGGHVQVTPKIYLVLWGWGEPGAFNHQIAGRPTYDPDLAGQRMTNFIKAIGGTAWMNVSTQYYETDASGNNTFITNPSNVFGGVWWDNTDPIHNNLSGLELAQEAQRAVAHFGVTDLTNSQFVIAQPQDYNEAGFNSGAGYCAWHDYTTPTNYPGVTPGISFTNMPYVLNAGTSCGEDQVNPSFYDGELDGFTIVMGHEIEETITDPGAGQPDVGTGLGQGAWYDIEGWENGDKCAWAGDTFGLTSPTVFPGGLNDITGSDGKQYPVQSLWSNDSASGAGYCAGAGNDLPTG